MTSTGPEITIHARGMFGNFITVKIDDTELFAKLQEKVAEIRKVPSKRVLLRHITSDSTHFKIGDLKYPDGRYGIVLDKDKTLREQNVGDESYFDLMIRLV